MERITPDLIAELKENEIFVFGSNLSGRHGAGAAKAAMQWGAIYGQGIGMQGRTYAIPTKNASITKALTLPNIGVFVMDLIAYAKFKPELTFLVTEIGCGLAGYTPKEIAPLFKLAVNISNIYLPKSFWKILKKII